MKKKQKVMLLAFAAVMSAGVVSTVAMSQGGSPIDVLANDNADSVVWKHYAAVAPTFTTHGSKEFWASCSALGTHVFTQPAKGIIEEGGDFSKSPYFAELDATDDRYVEKLTPKVTFDSYGGTEVTAQDVAYGGTATEPTNPTRAADDYYDSYTFDGWYKDGAKYNFETAVNDNVELTAKWKYGNKKYEQVTLSKDNVTYDDITEYKKEGSTPTFTTVSAAFSSLAWDNNAKKVDADVKAKLFEDFGGESKASSGICVVPTLTTGWSDWETQTFYLPKIDFKTALAGGKTMSMELGGYQYGSTITLNEQTIFYNEKKNSAAFLTASKVYFYLDGETVKARAFYRVNAADGVVYSCKEATIELSDDQASGTASVEIGLYSHASNQCYYFIGYPSIAKGEYAYKNLSGKENVTVTNGALETRAETESRSSGGAPWGWLKETCALSFDGVYALGNSTSAGLTVNYGKIDFNSLFSSHMGLRFTLGGFNGTYDNLTFKQKDFGNCAVRPAAPESYTADTIAGTWANFQIEITNIGMRVLNYNTGTEYLVSLSAEQLKGEEDLVFSFGTKSNGRFYYLSNLKAFHA